MAHSSALGSAASTLGSWLFAAACLGGSILYFDDVRELGRKVFGNPEARIATSDGSPSSDIDRSGAQDQTTTVQSRDGRVELTADARGHFIVEAQVNGRTIDVMVDTGATAVAMSFEDAERAGIYVRPSDYTQRANTANGIARIAPVKIDSISIGGITVRDVRGAVAEPGALSGTLLGMTFLSRLSRAELTRGRLILEE